MRRVLFIAAASVALLALGPADAFAKHHPRHRSHVRHAVVRHKRFGDVNPVPANPPASQDAGTVASFTGGVLTIKLNDGSTVSGNVTDATGLECEAAQPMQNVGNDFRSDHGPGGGDNNGGGGDNGGGDQGDNGGGDQGDDNESQSCSTTALTAGTVVREAELRISSAGAIWDKVELIA